VDVYGIPFSVIPFKGRPVGDGGKEDKPKNHVRALPERKHMEIRFPVVEGYAFALRQNLIRCDVGAMEVLELEPNREPTATYVLPQIGYKEGHAAKQPEPFGKYDLQDREQYYREHHLQTIKFEIARLVMDDLLTGNGNGGKSGAKARVFRLQSRHQLFPQVYRYVDEYVSRKVYFRSCHPSELGLERYVQRVVGLLRDAIEPDDTQGEPPLMPILNRYKPIGTTAEVDFKTIRPVVPTQRSHINQVVGDTKSWEAAAAFRLDTAKAVTHYARNDHLGCLIPYELLGVDHTYEPDFLVRLTNGATVVLEIKGFEEHEDRAKHEAAKKWARAVNNWGQLGQWVFHVCRDPQVLEREMGAMATA
jgi:type III restriction enzyme